MEEVDITVSALLEQKIIENNTLSVENTRLLAADEEWKKVHEVNEYNLQALKADNCKKIQARVDERVRTEIIKARKDIDFEKVVPLLRKVEELESINAGKRLRIDDLDIHVDDSNDVVIETDEKVILDVDVEHFSKLLQAMALVSAECADL